MFNQQFKAGLVTVAALMSIVRSQEENQPESKAIWPESDASFIYWDLMHMNNTNDPEQQMFVFQMQLQNLTSGENDVTFNLTPTANAEGIELVDKDCERCKVVNQEQISVSDPYFKSQQKERSGFKRNHIESYNNVLRENEYTLSQQYAKSETNVDRYNRFAEFHKNADKQQSILLIKEAEKPWDKTQTNGYFGFQLRDRDHNSVEKLISNFMWSITFYKTIKQNVISFYMRDQMGAYSYAKLGGFDEFALKNGKKEDMNLFKSTERYRWAIPIEKINGTSEEEILIKMDGIEDIQIEPSVRYMYVGEEIRTYERFIKPIEAILGIPEEEKADCGESASETDPSKVCYWSKKCSDIKSAAPSAFLNFVLKNVDDKEVVYPIDLHRYLIEPASDAADKNRCNLGVFLSKTSRKRTIVVGQEFMKEYYTMFDGLQFQLNKDNLPQIGIGAYNPDVDIKQIRYEPNFRDYQRADRKMDASVIAYGYEDQYDQEINVDPSIEPLFPWKDPVVEDNTQTIIIAAVVAVVVIIVIIVIAYCCCCKKKKGMPENRRLSSAADGKAKAVELQDYPGLEQNDFDDIENDKQEKKSIVNK